jgi:hypothetical protein
MKYIKSVLQEVKKRYSLFGEDTFFLRKFIPNLDEIIKNITSMLRKGNEIRWKTYEKHYFEEVKVALTKSHVLIIPYFSKDFIIFSFA